MTAIAWTDETLNVVTGCDIVSPGCGHCYAKDLAPRLRAMGNPKYQDANDGQPPTSGPAFGVTLHPHELEKPFRWRKPRRVFVCSMGDLFHEDVPSPFIDRAFAVMALTPHITYQVLTKRPERMRQHLSRVPRPGYGRGRTPSLAASPAARIGHQVARIVAERGITNAYTDWPIPNVWLGTSIELRTYAARADELRATPAAVRFISAEPLLGPLVDIMVCGECGNEPGEVEHCGDCGGAGFWQLQDPGALDLTDIDWLIVGGESGPEHRPINPEWVRDLVAVAEIHETAFFCKQGSGLRPGKQGKLPDDVWRLKEFPQPVARERLGRSAGGADAASGRSGVTHPCRPPVDLVAGEDRE